jgi:membrane protein DedA with SNARE-associated domain
MALWRRFWLLGSAIWVVVCLLSAFSILAFSEGEAAKALQPMLLAVAVPAIAYAALWIYFRLRSR